MAKVQADLRRRILRAFVGRGLIEKEDVKEMQAYQYSGFSVDAGVLIDADDRAALERLLRYCARPPFSMDRLRKEGAELVYRCTKQHGEPVKQVVVQTESVISGAGTPGVAPLGHAISPTPEPAQPKRAAH